MSAEKLFDKIFRFDRESSWKYTEPEIMYPWPDKKVFVLHMPVLHAGHWQLFAKYPDVRQLLLVDRDEFGRLSPVKKDLHALRNDQMIYLLERLNYFQQIDVLGERNAACWRNGYEFIVADDEVEAYLGELGLAGGQNKLIRENIFLRWTRQKVLAEQDAAPDEELTTSDESVQQIMARAQAVGQGSSDFWRQVGAVLVLACGETLVACNQHLPESQTPYIVGDIRGQFHRGEHWELGSSIHAEAGVIAQAARLGKVTEGAALYVTDFPCPNCAKLAAMAGIKTLYYQRGYTLADGREILAAAGVKVVRVEG